MRFFFSFESPVRSHERAGSEGSCDFGQLCRSQLEGLLCYPAWGEAAGWWFFCLHSWGAKGLHIPVELSSLTRWGRSKKGALKILKSISWRSGEIRELHQPNGCAARSTSPSIQWDSERGSFSSRPEQSEAFNFITGSLRGAQPCKSFKVIGEGVNIHTSERSWIRYEQDDASFKLVYGSWIIFQLCGCDNEFNVLF